jgi:hypothetical protein
LYYRYFMMRIALEDWHICIKTFFSLFEFLSFLSSFQLIILSKYSKLFQMISTICIHYNNYVLEPLWYEASWKIHKCIKTVFSLFELCFICSIILRHKITKIHKIYFELCQLFIYILIIMFSNLYDTNNVERLT